MGVRTWSAARVGREGICRDRSSVGVISRPVGGAVDIHLVSVCAAATSELSVERTRGVAVTGRDWGWRGNNKRRSAEASTATDVSTSGRSEKLAEGETYPPGPRAINGNGTMLAPQAAAHASIDGGPGRI